MTFVFLWSLMSSFSTSSRVRPKERRCRRRAGCNQPIDPCQRLRPCLDLTIELSVPGLFKQERQPGAGLQSVLEEVVAVDQRGRIDRAGRFELEVAPDVVDFVALAERGECVGLMQGEELVDC